MTKMSITKRELIDVVSRKAHLTKKGATEAVEVFLNEIGRFLSKGKDARVVLSGFGTFRVIRMKGKTVTIPKTDKMVTIKDHLSPRFTPGKKLKRQVTR
jgi:DNA-binding protein HU-beta